MGHLLQLKCAYSPLNQRILSSTSVPFTLTMVQVPNLALTHTKRFAVHGLHLAGFLNLEKMRLAVIYEYDREVFSGSLMKNYFLENHFNPVGLVS